MANERLEPPLSRIDGSLHIGGVSCVRFAEIYGTPLYVTDEDRIRCNYRRFYESFSSRWDDVRIYYAVKANSNLSVLRVLRQEGAGVDCSCIEEVQLASISGFRTDDMMLTANYLDADTLRTAFGMGLLVNLDDPSVLYGLSSEEAPREICLRINPGFGMGAFPTLVLAGKESKFGMAEETALKAYECAKALGVEKFGIHMMAGSCVLDPGYFGDITRRLLDIADRISQRVGIDFDFIDVGGGFGVPYRPSEKPLDIDLTADSIVEALREHYESGSKAPRLVLEPGRYLVCDSTVLLSRVLARKETEPPFVGIDAGMNSLLRPALYGAHHEILLSDRHETRMERVNVCGTICENTDIMAKDREMPMMKPGDVVAILNAGAYGFSMSSQYNTRPRPAEVLLKDGEHQIVREREVLADVIGRQHIPRRLEG